MEILHQLKLPSKLIALMDNFNAINYKSTLSSSASSSSISSVAGANTNNLIQNDNDLQSEGNMSLFEWITAQVIQIFISFNFIEYHQLEEEQNIKESSNKIEFL